MKHRNTPTQYARSLVLDHTTQFLKCVTIYTCVDCWTSRQKFHKRNTFSVQKHCAHDRASWNGLFESFLYWRWSVVCLHSMDCCFNSEVTCNTHVSSPVTAYHWITHGMFSIHLTKLMMNVSRFHVSWIRGKDYRLHFTCAGLLDFLEHFKHTGRCIKMVRLPANCVRAFQKDQ
jgi:hypothetical protein